MSESFVFERFDVFGDCDDDGYYWSKERAEFDGKWVKAEDAINREAVNADAIKTLTLQFKESKAEVLRLNAALATLHGNISQ